MHGRSKKIPILYACGMVGAVSFEACCQWALPVPNVQMTTKFTFWVYGKYIYPSVIMIKILLTFWKCGWTDPYLREGEQTRVPGETPQLPVQKSVSHTRGENSPPQCEINWPSTSKIGDNIEPSPSNIGDNFAKLSEHAGSLSIYILNPLNYSGCRAAMSLSLIKWIRIWLVVAMNFVLPSDVIDPFVVDWHKTSITCIYIFIHPAVAHCDWTPAGVMHCGDR